MNFVNIKIDPIVKWAGGKTKVYSQIRKKMPEELFNGKIRKYYEPFFGGGSVFLNVIKSAKFDKCVLSDINEELVLLYKVVKNDTYKLIYFLEKYLEQYSILTQSDKEKYYYDIRNTYNVERFNINHNDYSSLYIPRAAQMLFLNKTCYNGLYRQNLRGEFNVPFGKNYIPSIFNKKNIILLSEVLKEIEIECQDFQSVCSDIEGSDSFVYFDPPYKSSGKTAGFTHYHKSNFTDEDQIRLLNVFKMLNEKEVKLMMNNSCATSEVNSGSVESYYKDFKIDIIKTNSTMSSNILKRKKINELIITNY